MGRYTTDYKYSSFDNCRYGFRRYGRIDPIKIKCKCCGYTLSFIYHKKQICPVCLNYVYPDDKEHFRETLKKEIKNNERKEN